MANLDHGAILVNEEKAVKVKGGVLRGRHPSFHNEQLCGERNS
jgi:hypothetical protein